MLRCPRLRHGRPDAHGFGGRGGIISLLGVGDISSRPALVAPIMPAGQPVRDSAWSATRRPKLECFDEAHLLFTDAWEFERPGH